MSGEPRVRSSEQAVSPGGYRLLVALAVLLGVLPAVLTSFRNLPYYRYVDEGHLVLWTRSIVAFDAPENIFYGPLYDYLLAALGLVVDPIAALFGREVWWSPSALAAGRPRPGFYNDFHPLWVLPAARLLSAAFTALGIVCAAKFLRRTAGRAAGAAGAFATAAVPAFAVKAGHAQVEMGIVGLVLLLIAVGARWSREGFTARRSVIFALLVALLASLKIYALVYAGLGILCFAGSPPERRWRHGLIFVLSALVLTLLLYLPYRTPGELIDVMKWAGQYYEGKEPGSLARAAVSPRQLSAVHLALAALGVVAMFLRGAPLVLRLAGLAAAVNFAYFARLPFAATRNIYPVFAIATLAGVWGLFRVGSGIRAFSGSRLFPRAAVAMLAVLAAAVAVRTGVAEWWPEDPRLALARELQNEEGRPRLFLGERTPIHDSTLPGVEIVRLPRGRIEEAGLARLRSGDLLVLRAGEAEASPAVRRRLGAAELVGVFRGPGDGAPRGNIRPPRLLLYRYRGEN